MVAAENVNVNNLGTISKSAVAGGQGKKIEGWYGSLDGGGETRRKEH